MLIAALLPHIGLVLCHLTCTQAIRLDHGPTACKAQWVVEERAVLPPPVVLEPPTPQPEAVDSRAPMVRAVSTAWAVTAWLRTLRPLRHPWDVHCTSTAARCARPAGQDQRRRP